MPLTAPTSVTVRARRRCLKTGAARRPVGP
jgi:hypothetical protein